MSRSQIKLFWEKTFDIYVNGRRYVLKLLSKDPVAKNGFPVIYALPEFEKYFGMPVDVKITCKVADEALYLVNL